MHTQLTVSRSNTRLRLKYSTTATPTARTEQMNCRMDRPKKERFAVSSNFFVDFCFLKFFLFFFFSLVMCKFENSERKIYICFGFSNGTPKEMPPDGMMTLPVQSGWG